jgi:hypothetical protein
MPENTLGVYLRYAEILYIAKLMCHRICDVHCNMMMGLFLPQQTTQYCQPFSSFDVESKACGSRKLAVSRACLIECARLTIQFNTRDGLVYVPKTPR